MTNDEKTKEIEDFMAYLYEDGFNLVFFTFHHSGIKISQAATDGDGAMSAWIAYTMSKNEHVKGVIENAMILFNENKARLN